MNATCGPSLMLLPKCSKTGIHTTLCDRACNCITCAIRFALHPKHRLHHAIDNTARRSSDWRQCRVHCALCRSYPQHRRICSHTVGIDYNCHQNLETQQAYLSTSVNTPYSRHSSHRMMNAFFYLPANGPACQTRVILGFLHTSPAMPFLGIQATDCSKERGIHGIARSLLIKTLRRCIRHGVDCDIYSTCIRMAGTPADLPAKNKSHTIEYIIHLKLQSLFLCNRFHILLQFLIDLPRPWENIHCRINRLDAHCRVAPDEENGRFVASFNQHAVGRQVVLQRHVEVSHPAKGFQGSAARCVPDIPFGGFRNG